MSVFSWDRLCKLTNSSAAFVSRPSLAAKFFSLILASGGSTKIEDMCFGAISEAENDRSFELAFSSAAFIAVLGIEALEAPFFCIILNSYIPPSENRGDMSNSFR
ncbi:hypothetical protein D3C78_1289700 [compost metagenome]